MKNANLQKLKMPQNPGVYFFKSGKEIIYIGKATSLKSRVRSYFSKDLIQTRGPLLVDMVFHSDNISWQETDSVLEALILEAELIKKYQPKYNTKEKDDKSFNYVVITKPARNASRSDAGGEKLPKVLIVRGKDLLQKQKNSARFTLPGVPGGTYATHNFSASFTSVFGPYTNGSQLKEAMKIIRRIFPFLDEKSTRNYEFYRQVYLVPDILSKEGVEQYKKNIKYLKLFLKGKKKDIMREIKKEMMLKAKVHQFEIAGELKRQLFALKHINDIALLKPETNVYELDLAFRIEAYDIAHMGGKNMVGVMTVVENGNVNKNEYRKFKIRTLKGANDTGAIKEVIERRMNHSEWKMPDLIVVDGGVAQINMARGVLKKLGIKSIVVAVVKDDRHKPKAILGDEEYSKKFKSAILLANNESHRFAISYHKNMRGKNFLQIKRKPK
ncbi:MAG: GIY-YIG nuclease family protein [Candidatus Paceibacterota bacterium]